MDWRLNPFGGGDAAPRDLRTEMIGQTEAFLNWALAEEREFPRIPRRRVDKGGFTALLREPAARALVNAWWLRVLKSELLER